ncbi:SAM-dependent methyltransferase [Amycolatopsis sp. cg5]|uniref:SAM-dependent methyltransferase n=1 Tax=Amycolatopsis sp. cg5 TaxID=3238802 RepID=UPI00352609A5
MAAAEIVSGARVYDYYLGGTHNLEIDRAFVRKVQSFIPRVGDYVKENRAALGRVVKTAYDMGFRQFVDIGSGIPAIGNVHDVLDRHVPANRVPDARVVYIDNEVAAVTHAQEVLASGGDPTRHRALNADLLRPEELWSQVVATGILDMEAPICLIAFAVLHFIKDDRDPDGAMGWYRDRLPAKSMLALSTMTNEAPESPAEAESLRRLVSAYEGTTNPGQLRTTAEFSRFFGDFDLISPGLCYAPSWRPDSSGLFDVPSESRFLVGVGLKGAGAG